MVAQNTSFCKRKRSQEMLQLQLSALMPLITNATFLSDLKAIADISASIKREYCLIAIFQNGDRGTNQFSIETGPR